MTFAFLFTLALLQSFSHTQKEHPNIVLIFADDIGYGDLSCYGANHLQTPNIDQLAKQGKRFTDCHSASAVCSPSRYGLLTGRYPFRRNLWGPVPIRQELTIDTDRLTIASLLKGAGYNTACIGKWHLGFGEGLTDWNAPIKPGPLELGFDTFFGVPTVNSGPPFVYVKDHHVFGYDPTDPFVLGKESVTRKFPEKGGYKAIGGAEAAHRLHDDEKVATTLTEKAVSWIKQQNREKPFFLYLATTNIHHPFTPAKQFVETSQCGLYGDFVHELDWLVGEVTKTLDDQGLTDNTLIIFTSDNGGMFHNTGQKAFKAGHLANGKLLGYKFGAWEGGHRVPMIAKWPGKIKEGTQSDHLFSQIDLFATFAGIVDQPIPLNDAEDSIDQLDLFLGEPKSDIRNELVICPNSPKHLSIRVDDEKGDWIYIPQQGAGGFQGKKPGNHLFTDQWTFPFTGKDHSDYKDGTIRPDAPPAQLYNLKADPTQQMNVYHDHPEIVKELDQKLKTYRNQIPKIKPVGWINLKQ